MRQALAVMSLTVLGMLGAAEASAQIYQVADGPVSVQYPAGHFSSTPTANLFGTSGGLDPVYESGWWYSIVGVSTREYPLGTPDTAYQDGAYLSFRWNDVGGTPLQIVERVTVADLARPGGAGGYVSTISAVVASGGEPMQVRLFHYLDPDAGGTAAGDQAQSLIPYGRRGYLRFSDGADVLRYRGINRTGDSVYHQVTPYAQSVRDLLNDADLDTLTNGVSAGPGDLTAAFEFLVTVPYSSVFWPMAQVTVANRAAADYLKGDVSHSGLYPSVFFQNAAGYTQAWPMRRSARFEDANYPTLVPTSRDIVGIDAFTSWPQDQYLTRDRVTGVHYLDDDALVGPALSSDWRVAATGDLSHDGKADVLFRNTITQKLSVWLMNGAAAASTVTPSPDQAVNGNWEVVGLGDFNNDLNLDFLWYNQTSRKLVIWYMDANLQRITGGFTNPPEVGNGNWKAVAVGDWGLGGATYGTPDILWRNDTSGRLVLWNMDFAGNRTSGQFLTPDSNSGATYMVVGPR